MLQTVGLELCVAEVELPDDKTRVQLQVLDCGGNAAQLDLVDESLGSGLNFCILAYSVSDR